MSTRLQRWGSAGCALALVCGLAGAQVGPQTELRAEIEARALAGEYQQAMGLAHGIGGDAQRSAVEADLLYRSRSYRAALGRVQEAVAGGVQTPLVLARGLASSLWLGEPRVAREFWGLLEASIDELPSQYQAAWRETARSLGEQIAELEAQRLDLEAHVTRARRLATGLGALAVLVMLGLLPRGARSR